jgi:hypothetical protein
VNLQEAKSKYGHRFFYQGKLDAVNEMFGADDENFDQAVKQRIKIGKPNSGYILSPHPIAHASLLLFQFRKNPCYWSRASREDKGGHNRLPVAGCVFRSTLLSF